MRGRSKEWRTGTDEHDIRNGHAYVVPCFPRIVSRIGADPSAVIGGRSETTRDRWATEGTRPDRRGEGQKGAH